MVWADSDGHHHHDGGGAHGGHGALTDLDGREKLLLAVLAVFVFLLGFKPGLVLDLMQVSVRQLLAHLAL